MKRMECGLCAGKQKEKRDVEKQGDVVLFFFREFEKKSVKVFI